MAEGNGQKKIFTKIPLRRFFPFPFPPSLLQPTTTTRTVARQSPPKGASLPIPFLPSSRSSRFFFLGSPSLKGPVSQSAPEQSSSSVVCSPVRTVCGYRLPRAIVHLDRHLRLKIAHPPPLSASRIDRTRRSYRRQVRPSPNNSIC